jgi:hypothetical protein
LTAPNPWNRTSKKFLKKNIEIINTDHKYWFTPYTLSKILYEAGYKVEEIMFSYNNLPKYNFIKREMLKHNFLKADSIIIEAIF